MIRLVTSLLTLVLYTSVAFSQANPELKADEQHVLMKFRVIDFEGLPEADAVVKISTADGKLSFTGKSDEDGLYDVLVPKGSVFALRVEKFDTAFTNFNPIKVPLQAGPIVWDYKIKIKVVPAKYLQTWELDVLFATNDYKLDFQHMGSLNALLAQLKKNAKMRIEIAAHTDNVGDDAYNMRLSQRRANSVKEYLIEKGIDESRVLSKGYGESKPVAPNDSEAGRKKNRRVEVRVIEE